jgi:hypothetical protein
MNRPFGATVLAVLGFVRGLWWLFVGLNAFGFSFFYSFTDPQNAGVFYFYLSITLLPLGLFTLFLSYGLWTVQAWAWMWMIIVQGVGLFVELIRLVLSGMPTFSGFALNTLGILIIVYLLTPQVRAAYLR